MSDAPLTPGLRGGGRAGWFKVPDDLSAGTYTVDVNVSTIPVAVTQTFDPDTVFDSSTTYSLAEVVRQLRGVAVSDYSATDVCGDLLQQLAHSFKGAVIGAVQCLVDVDDDHQRHAGKVMPLGHQLRANDEVVFALGDVPQGFGGGPVHCCDTLCNIGLRINDIRNKNVATKKY